MESKDESKEKTEKPKKRPGRPRKKPIKDPVERKGVADEPKKDNNNVELMYDEPTVFKKAFQIFKAMQASELQMIFDEREIRVSSKNHMRNADIVVTFDCNRMVHYYCNQKTVVVLNQKNIEKINKVLGGSHTMVTIVCKKNSFRSSIIFVFQNEMKIDEVHEVKLIIPTMDNSVNMDNFKTDEHPIRFEMPCKFFKKLITDSASFSDTLSIRKVGSGELTFSHLTEDKMIKSQHIVKDEKLIKLYADIDEEKTFLISVKLDYIKPLADALIADAIEVCAHQEKRWCSQARWMADASWSVFVAILTKHNYVLRVTINDDGTFFFTIMDVSLFLGRFKNEASSFVYAFTSSADST